MSQGKNCNDQILFGSDLLELNFGGNPMPKLRISLAHLIEIAREEGRTKLRFPKHYSLRLEHNEHKSFNEPNVQQWLDNFEVQPDWVSEDQKSKAIETGDVWMMRWYPSGTVSSFCLCACDLDILLENAIKE